PPVAGALGRGRTRRAGGGPRHAARPSPASSSGWAMGAGGGPTLVDCVVSQFSGHNSGGKPRMVLAACDGSLAAGAVGAYRAGVSHCLPHRGVSSGWSAFPGGGVWRHSGTAALSGGPRGGAHHGFTATAGWPAHRAPERYPHGGLYAPHGPATR